jgi:hypothetical protein
VSPAISLFPPPLFENSSAHGWVAAQHVYPDEAPCIDRLRLVAPPSCPSNPSAAGGPEVQRVRPQVSLTRGPVRGRCDASRDARSGAAATGSSKLAIEERLLPSGCSADASDTFELTLRSRPTSRFPGADSAMASFAISSIPRDRHTDESCTTKRRDEMSPTMVLSHHVRLETQLRLVALVTCPVTPLRDTFST